MKKKFLNEKRKASMIAFFYKIAELLLAGIAIAGVVNADIPAKIIWAGFVGAVASYAMAFYLEGDP
ncbi:MAG: hypothetical protein WC314_25675 [Vulcanimicrobiota bacterium]